MVSLRRSEDLAGSRMLQSAVTAVGQLAGELSALRLERQFARSILVAIGFVAAMTLCLIGVTSLMELQHVSSAYLIPVLIVAIRLGMVPALVAACGAVAASAFFFYPPIYDFRVHNPQQLLDLFLFVVVAIVTSQLAARAQASSRLAQEREGEMRALYAYSKRLAVTTDAAEIYAAIRDHVSSITGRRVVYFEAGAASPGLRHRTEGVPDSVERAADALLRQPGKRAGVWVNDERTGTRWFLRAVSPENAAFGLVAIHLDAVMGPGPT